MEAALVLVLTRLALLFVPFRKIASLLGDAHFESPRELTIAQAVWARRVGWAVGTMNRHTFEECTCLSQAITAQWMLRRRGVPSTLYLGLAKRDGNLIAHAWVRGGNMILTGAPSHRQFTVVATLAECSHGPRKLPG
jgi:hypothetical protein